MALQFRKGTAAERNAATSVPLPGEPWFTVDDGQLYVGDGITPGGINVGANTSLNALTNVETTQEQVLSIGTYTINSNAVIITTTTTHQYYPGLLVSISGSPVSILNGTHAITDATPGTSVFVFTLVTANVATTSTTGTITPQIPDGSALIWNQTDGHWQDGTPAMGIDDLNDVDTSTTAPTDGQYLAWDNAEASWVPTTLALGLDDLTDVDLTTTAPTTGDILVYNGTSSSFEPDTIGINALNDVNTASIAPSDGDVLTWDAVSSNWKAAAPAPTGSNVLHTTFVYQLATAPTSVVANSDLLGKNLGTVLEQTAANKVANSAGPATAAFDPSLSGITFNPTTGIFSGIPQGRYWINFSFDVIVNNPTPSFYTSPPLLVITAVGFSLTSGSLYDPAPFGLGLLPYTSYGSASANLSYATSFIYVADDVDSLTNTVQVVLDQDQGPAFYVKRADIDFIKLDG